MANIAAASQTAPKYHNKYNVNVLAYDTWYTLLEKYFKYIFLYNFPKGF